MTQPKRLVEKLAEEYVEKERASARRCCVNCAELFDETTHVHVRTAAIAMLEAGIRLAAERAETIETRWFDSDVPAWLAKELGSIKNAIRALLEERAN